MEWKLIDVIKETEHRFLNFYTVKYQVKKDDGTIKNTEYYMVSRKEKEEIRPLTHEYHKSDAVMIALYHIDEKTNEVSVVITTQFRPALGTYMTSIPAGLMDKDDKDVKETAKREALEEAGVLIDDIEVLADTSTTSSGMSDEMNSLVLGRVVGFAKNDLEEFEDIKAKLIPLKTVKEMLNDKSYCIPLTTRLVMIYLIERFNIK